MSLERPEFVSDLVIYLLNELGVEYAPLNPGATIRGLHESVVNYGNNTNPELITCCHEELAVAMAEGFYLATGRSRWPTISWASNTPARPSTRRSLTTSQ